MRNAKKLSHSEISLSKKNSWCKPIPWQVLHLQNGNSIVLVAQAQCLQASWIPLFFSPVIYYYVQNIFEILSIIPALAATILIHLSPGPHPATLQSVSTQPPLKKSRANVGSRVPPAGREAKPELHHLTQRRGSFCRAGGRT